MIAVDGGNSKTDLALLSPGGALLSWVRGPGCALGPRRAAELIARLTAAAAAAARPGLAAADPAPADLAEAHASCLLAGADLPHQIEALHSAIAATGGYGSVSVDNDAWALLRLGAPAGAPAVAVVCGAGLKCVARSGAIRYEFPSLGWQTGDLSGAGDFLAREAVRVAARAEDGRGPATSLRDAVRARLGVPEVAQVAERLLDGTLREDRLGVLAPDVLAHAEAGDPPATAIVRGLAEEVATLARTARQRVEDVAAASVGEAAAASPGWTLVLGGGLFTDPSGRLLSAVRSADPLLAEEFTLRVADAPPVVGAALLGFDQGEPVGPALERAVRAAFAGARPLRVEETAEAAASGGAEAAAS
ncbi:BadF/BadG/BcrA/BcrD ATPase family protein [Phaeacidiphilus oryzae]|uniref:BadF/BadG/BcrA/BcrD ATPase family protein n=1 Tax=Phaeacidiphilus oryzae TaxID=348818 RepID=UPI0006916867|nr:BadF/BadG/BcrA/BcrD ATPase family protein [Phaeacidiphilus oryzae]